MPDMLNQSEMFPFLVAIALVFIMALLEVISMAFGAALSSVIDGVLPDFGLDADIDVGTDMSTGLSLLAWFKVGQIPMLIILVCFALVFGIVGIVMQLTLGSTIGKPLPAAVAVVLALPVTLPLLKGVLEGLAKVLPGDETEAVSGASFAGLTGTVVLGEARRGSPAQAKVRNDRDQTHYIMVEPAADDDVLHQGAEIVLGEQKNGIYLATPTARV